MNKQKTSFKCKQCTYQTIKWMGCCPECKSWDSMAEVVTGSGLLGASRSASITTMTSLHSVTTQTVSRMLSGIKEWDRVVGNGIMPASLLILTGDPGIGKSTLLLQISNSLASTYSVFYFSTEESLQQI